MQTSRNTESRPIDTHKPFYCSSYVEWTRIIICASVYIAASFILRLIASDDVNRIVICGIAFSIYVFSGIIVQAQVLSSVYLTINTMTRGYIAAVVINVCGICFAIFGIVINKTQNALPGIITYLGTIVVITVIHNYRKRLNNSMKEMTSQKEELYTLYEEISSSEEKLGRQNEQLVKYNHIMKDHEKQLRHMAFFDALTGLPNRKMVIERLDALIRKSSKNKSGFSFIFIDLDDFKEINDLMGHYIGDIMLQAVVERWKKYIHGSDMLGRLGGDEFALLIHRDLSREDILSCAESLKKAISDAFVYQRKELYINASFGICVYPQDGNNSTELLKKSDIAMYNVKNSGKNGIKFFCQSMQNRMQEKIQLENGLKSAIANNELYVEYQPQYYSRSKRIRGFEALARWNSPELGQVSPSKFIPIAEEAGQIIEIGEWILRTALNKFKGILAAGNHDYIVSVNISVVQIIHPDFVKMVQGILDETGFNARSLEFEVTESVFISNPESVINALRKLNAMGIRIALDDFGTGYASLKYLQMLPINTLKIDKAFIDSINEQNRENKLVSSIISLTHEFQVTVVAEGVENEIQLDYLTKKDCDCIQGFLLSRPLGASQLDKLISGLEDNKRKPYLKKIIMPLAK